MGITTDDVMLATAKAMKMRVVAITGKIYYFVKIAKKCTAGCSENECDCVCGDLIKVFFDEQTSTFTSSKFQKKIETVFNKQAKKLFEDWCSP